MIASNVAGAREWVEDGVNGLLYEAGNAGALAAALQRLQGDPEFARSLGENARTRYLAEFTPAKGYERIMQLAELW